MMRRIDLTLPSNSYSIIIESGLLQSLGSRLTEISPDNRGGGLLAVDANIVATHGKTAQQSLAVRGYHMTMQPIPADEEHKTLETVRQLYDAMLSAKLERGSFIIALGGGVVGDVAGFAAATYLRGIPVIQIPTTLLAMVDASIGGKTGVNYSPAQAGSELLKNIIGAFWQPRAVLIDPEVLTTLPPRDFRCGLAECVKHGMIADIDLLTFLAEHASEIFALDMDVLPELIERSARIKAAIVEQDERESNQRALLNLGHTFAHAIEPIASLDLRHGEAVAIGLAAAMNCAVDMKHMTEDEAQSVLDLLELFELPTRLPHPVAMARLIQAMSHDKKVLSGRIRLVLPRGLGEAELLANVPIELVQAAWLKVGAASDE